MVDYGAFSSVPFCHFLEPDVDMGSHYSSKRSRTSPRRLYNPLDMRRTTKDLRSKTTHFDLTTSDKFGFFAHFIFSFSLFSSFQQTKTFQRSVERTLSFTAQRGTSVLNVLSFTYIFDNRRLGWKTLANIIKEKIMWKRSSCSRCLSLKYQHKVWPGPKISIFKEFLPLSYKQFRIFFPFREQRSIDFFDIPIAWMLASLWPNPSK